MPRVRVRRVAGTSRRSHSASSEPVGRIRPRARRVRQHVVRAGRGRRAGAAAPRVVNNATIPRPRRRNQADVGASGQINRRNNRRTISASPIHLLTSRESLDILRCYLIDCERNLIECQQQRGRLAHMVEQLIQVENQTLVQEHNPTGTTTMNVTQEEYRLVHPTGEDVHTTSLETTHELSELITSVRFVAEHRGEDTQHTLNELMRLRNEASPLPCMEMDHEDADNNPSAPPYSDGVVDYVVQGCEFDSPSQVNGILTVVFGMDEGDQGGVNDELVDGSNQV